MLQSMAVQRVRHNSATEQDVSFIFYIIFKNFISVLLTLAQYPDTR